MSKEEIEAKIKELEAQLTQVMANANQQIGRLSGQIEVYKELLKTAEDK